MRPGIPAANAKTMFSTNIIESAFSVGRTVMGNVKHWQPKGKTRMIERWCAAGWLVAE